MQSSQEETPGRGSVNCSTQVGLGRNLCQFGKQASAPTAKHLGHEQKSTSAGKRSCLEALLEQIGTLPEEEREHCAKAEPEAEREHCAKAEPEAEREHGAKAEPEAEREHCAKAEPEREKKGGFGEVTRPPEENFCSTFKIGQQMPLSATDFMFQLRPSASTAQSVMTSHPAAHQVSVANKTSFSPVISVINGYSTPMASIARTADHLIDHAQVNKATSSLISDSAIKEQNEYNETAQVGSSRNLSQPTLLASMREGCACARQDSATAKAAKEVAEQGSTSLAAHLAPETGVVAQATAGTLKTALLETALPGAALPGAALSETALSGATLSAAASLEPVSTETTVPEATLPGIAKSADRTRGNMLRQPAVARARGHMTEFEVVRSRRLNSSVQTGSMARKRAIMRSRKHKGEVGRSRGPNQITSGLAHPQAQSDPAGVSAKARTQPDQEKAEAGKEKSGSQSDLKADKDRAETPKTKICFQWEESGLCTYEDRCHFSHDPTKKGNMIRKLDTTVEIEQRGEGMIVKGTDQIFSGLVQLSEEELPESLSDLRGTLAQACGIRGENTLRQVHGATPGQDTASGQFAEMAAAVGLHSSLFGWPDEKQKVLRTRYEEPRQGYLKNILDTRMNGKSHHDQFLLDDVPDQVFVPPRHEANVVTNWYDGTTGEPDEPAEPKDQRNGAGSAFQSNTLSAKETMSRAQPEPATKGKRQRTAGQRNDLVAKGQDSQSGDGIALSRAQRRRAARAARKGKDAESPAHKGAQPAHPKASSYGSGKDKKPRVEKEATEKKDSRSPGTRAVPPIHHWRLRSRRFLLAQTRNRRRYQGGKRQEGEGQRRKRKAKSQAKGSQEQTRAKASQGGNAMARGSALRGSQWQAQRRQTRAKASQGG